MRIAIVCAVIAAILAAVAVVVVSSDPPAQVSGQKISSEDIKNTPPSVYASAPPSVCPGSCLSSEKQKLRALIFNRWLDLQAAKDNIVISSSQVETLYQANLGTWKQTRQGPEPTAEAARYFLLANRLSEGVPVEAGAVSRLARKIAAEQPRVNSTPDTVYRNLQVVRSDSGTNAIEARAALEGGSPLSRVVARYGSGKQSRANYDLPNSPSGSLGPKIEQELRLVRPPRLIGPIESGGSWWVVNYLSLAKQIPDSKALAQSVLSQATAQVKLDKLPDYLRERWAEKTVCRDSLKSSFCRSGSQSGRRAKIAITEQKLSQISFEEVGCSSLRPI